jgi:hypothetical protein
VCLSVTILLVRVRSVFNPWLLSCRLPPFAQLAQKFVGRDKERILLEDAADDHHRVRAENIHDDVGTEPGHIVSSADGIVVLGQDVIQPSLVLHNVVDAGPIFQRPLHVRHQPGQGEAAGRSTGQHLFD